MGGINITDGKVGANVQSGDEKNSALLIGGVEVATKIALGEVKTIYSPEDARSLGLNDAYDTDNNVRVYYHIKEFYRIAGKGVRLILMLVDPSLTMEELIEDTGLIYAKKLLIDASDLGYPVHQLAVGLNPEDGYVAVIVDGVNSDVMAAITQAKGLTEWANTQHLDTTILLEGRDFTGLAGAAHDFKAENAVEHNRVGLVIAQDYDYAETLDALGKKHAAIGTALGSVAKRAVNESIGWVEEMNLQDTVAKAFLNCGISSHTPVKTLGNGDGSQTETLINKGYLFARNYPGTPGYFWASDFTCTPTIVDEDNNVNIHSISQSRTCNKLFRGLRKQLTPKIQSVVKVNSVTGLLDEGAVIYLQDEGDKVFERSENAQEIVSGRTIVDPAISVDGKLDVSFEYVKTTILGEVNGTVNQKLKF